MHTSSNRYHSVRMSATPDSAPGATRTHTARILRVQHGEDCGLYLRLCPHRGPHQPHQQAKVHVISCHEPCHAATDRRGSSLPDGCARGQPITKITTSASSSHSSPSASYPTIRRASEPVCGSSGHPVVRAVYPASSKTVAQRSQLPGSNPWPWKNRTPCGPSR